MIKESLRILSNLYPDREIVQRAKSSYSMYISGEENFIIGVDYREEDKIYFCPYLLQSVREKRND